MMTNWKRNICFSFFFAFHWHFMTLKTRAFLMSDSPRYNSCAAVQGLNLIRIETRFFFRTPPHWGNLSWKWLHAQFIIWWGWGEPVSSEARPLSGWNGNFSPSLISLWVSSAVSAVGTQKRNSVKAPCSLSLSLWELFSTACSHPPFPPHELTCWKKHMLLFPLPDSLCCLNGILLREEAVVWKVRRD